MIDQFGWEFNFLDRQKYKVINNNNKKTLSTRRYEWLNIRYDDEAKFGKIRQYFGLFEKQQMTDQRNQGEPKKKKKDHTDWDLINQSIDQFFLVIDSNHHSQYVRIGW